MGFYAPRRSSATPATTASWCARSMFPSATATTCWRKKPGNFTRCGSAFARSMASGGLTRTRNGSKKTQLSFRSMRSMNPESRDSGFVAVAPPRNDDAGGADDWAMRIVAARQRRRFTSLEDFARDTALPKRALMLLAMPMRSAPSGSTGAPRCGRCGGCPTTWRCRCSRWPPRANSRTRRRCRCR